MKKITALLLTMAIVLPCSACVFDSTAKKAVTRATVSMKEGDYDSALTVLKFVKDDGTKNKEALELYDIVSAYVSAEDSYNKQDYQTASAVLATINPNYTKYLISSDIDNLKSKLKDTGSASALVKQASDYIADKNYAQARVALDMIDKTTLTPEQKISFDTMKNIVDEKLDSVQSSPGKVVYYVPSYYEGLVPSYSGDFLYPSDSEYILDSYLNLCSKNEVALIRNEIYARHGYIFKLPEYRNYFNSKYWYSPNSNFSTNMFNTIEKANIQTIVNYEKRMGWN